MDLKTAKKSYSMKKRVSNLPRSLFPLSCAVATFKKVNICFHQIQQHRHGKVQDHVHCYDIAMHSFLNVGKWMSVKGKSMVVVVAAYTEF